MKVKLRIVHSNDDVHEQECDSVLQAILTASELERKRHGEKFKLGDLDFYKRWDENNIQFGTDYHYVVIEEMK